MSNPDLPLPIRWIERRTPPELQDYLVGDLQEEYARRARRSRIVAWLWALREAVRFRAGAVQKAAGTVDGRWGGGRPSAMARTGGGGTEMWLRDFGYSLRRLSRSPGFTLVAILSLALGTGANTAVFTLFQNVFLADAGIRNPETVVRVTRVVGDSPYWRITWADYRSLLEEGGGAFENASGWRETTVRTGASGDQPVTGILVSGDFFGTMGAEMALGRALIPGEETDVPGARTAAVVSHDFWRRALSEDPDAVGSTLEVEGQPLTLVGVAAPGFNGVFPGLRVDIYLPDPEAVTSTNNNLYGSARLAEGVTLERARAAVDAIAARINETRPAALSRRAYTLTPRNEFAMDPGIDGFAQVFSLLLFGAAGMVLFVTCTNLASFQLARMADRRRDFAVRRAVGASPAVLLRQLLIEAMTLSMAGALLGVLVGWAGLRLLLSSELPLGDFLRLDPSPDLLVLGFTVAVALVAGLIFGVLPALGAARTSVASVLRSDASGVIGGSDGRRARGALVVGQISLALALLITGGLFARSLFTALNVDPGFDRHGVAAVTVDPGASGFDGEQGRDVYRDVLRRAAADPGVEQVALATRVPMELGTWNTLVRRPDEDLPEGISGRNIDLTYLTPGYFRLMGIELQQGRDFDGSDDAPDAEPTIVLNRAAVDELWPEVPNPVGRTLLLPSWEIEARVVGIVGTAKLHTMGEPPTPHIYRPLLQTEQSWARILARGPGAEGPLPERLRQLAKEQNSDLFVHSATTVERITDVSFFLPRMGAVLMAVFGVLALVIASLGLWGLVSYTIARREREIGIRLALGAHPAAVVRTMMQSGTRLTLVGAGIGVILGVAAGWAFRGFLFRITAWDPVTLIAVPALLIAISVLAAWIPARRAARIDPMVALRSD